jgi:phage N-6-adenine-methyltransferase
MSCVDAQQQGTFVTLWRVTKRGRPPINGKAMTDAERMRRYRGDNHWNTPSVYIEAAREVLGGIDLDPASNGAAQERIKARTFYTADDNGLAHEWRGRVWLNPPYAQPLISQFVGKLVREVRAGRVTAAIMLTHNCTETRWFQEAAQACSVTCFPCRRIAFEKPDGPKASPVQGQTFFYFGDDVSAFRRVFGEFGHVGRPHAV